jgi:predicted anti-sigma-YlaC factor YlaD
MTPDAHDEARQLVALGRVEELPGARQIWLRSHLEECAACKEYAEAAGRAVQALRSVTLAADARLVRATQMRVRFHAGRLREARERMWVMGLACLGVGLSAAVTAPVLWRLFVWMGEQVGVSGTVVQASFAVFYIVPALAVSVLLLARGIHLASDSDQRQGR